MVEMFKKLEGYETVGNDKLSEWDKLEATLPKKRKKRIGCFWTIPALIILVFLTQDNNTSIERNNTKSLNNSIKKSEVFNKHKSLNFKSKVNPSSKIDVNSEDIIKEIDKTKPNLTNLDVQSINKISNLTFMTSKNLLNNNIKQLRIDSVLENNQLKRLLFNKISLIPISKITSDPDFILTSIEHILKPKGHFTLYGGIRTSIINKLSNLNNSQPSYSLGGLIQLDYETSKIIGLSLKCGLQSEYNHDLKYSYISDKEIFFRKSEKVNNINFKKLTTINCQFSVLFNWGPKHVSHIGGYFSHAIQSKSNVSVVGSGKYFGEHKQDLGQKNYHDLINPMDIGIFLAQNYRFHPKWLISLEFFMGTNNRLNNSYFNGQHINRKEVSLSILKNI